MGHGHHHHQPTVGSFERAFGIAIAANSLFVVVQMTSAYWAHSTSLFADAVHNLGDVFSLAVAWLGNRLLQRRPSDRSTYGLKKASILAALINVILLVFSCGVIATEAVMKLLHPAEVNAGFVMLIASAGIVVNAGTALLFARSKHDLNLRAAFLHLMADALVSLGVVLSAALLYWTGWLWLDPLMGLLIAVIILNSSWSLLTDSLRLILDGVPRGISLPKVRELLHSLPGVTALHDLHVWAISTQENALSVHVWMPEQSLSDQDRHSLAERLKTEHNIHHITIQVERDRAFCDDRCQAIL